MKDKISILAMLTMQLFAWQEFIASLNFTNFAIWDTLAKFYTILICIQPAPSMHAWNISSDSVS